jgi:hypothetical protein
MACYVARMAGQVEGIWGDECAAARPYQQRQSDCDGGGDCDGADAVTDGRQQVAAVFWIAEGGVVGLGWLAGGAEERAYRAPNVNLDGSSSSFPRNRRARTITRLPVYLSVSLARSLPLHSPSFLCPSLPAP